MEAGENVTIGSMLELKCSVEKIPELTSVEWRANGYAMRNLVQL